VDPLDAGAQSEVAALTEVKTVWHPIGA